MLSSLGQPCHASRSSSSVSVLLDDRGRGRRDGGPILLPSDSEVVDDRGRGRRRGAPIVLPSDSVEEKAVVWR